MEFYARERALLGTDLIDALEGSMLCKLSFACLKTRSSIND